MVCFVSNEAGVYLFSGCLSWFVSGVKWSGVVWSRVEWSGSGSGVEWSGVEWSRAGLFSNITCFPASVYYNVNDTCFLNMT